MDKNNSGLLKKLVDPTLARTLIAAAVGLTGLVTVGGILLAVLHIHRSHIVLADARATLFVGLSLIYLASLLRRGKRTAWLIAVVLYLYLLVRNLRHFDFDLSGSNYSWHFALINILLPVLVLVGLLINWQVFNVKSELRNFTRALTQSAVVLMVAILYGVIGFQLIDQRDFHQDIPLLTGAHYTIDQFDLTTSKQLVPQTKRAQLFLDSLGAISLGSVFYVIVSLFAPIRFRLVHSARDYEDMQRLLKEHPSTSEDFFKLWPRDKAYLFNLDRSTGLAYKVTAGTAMVVGDPVGKSGNFAELLDDYIRYCHVNDWDPAFIHTEKTNLSLYKKLGFEAQKIGEEAIVDTESFVKNVMGNKYFRHIANRFEREKYTTEVLRPPHSAEVLHRLRDVSNEWLRVPGRAERGFMLGYFSDEYMQVCQIVVARDHAGTIQAFLNRIPSFNNSEASYDFLRHTSGSPGNINDYLMINFINYLHQDGVARLNMGLSPLAGLEPGEGEDRSVINSVLSLAYSKAGRFYSFQGLNRFKSKYEPKWEDRYIVYKGGIAGFSRTTTALVRAMSLPRRHRFFK